MTFDDWFAVQPHPAMSDEEIEAMRKDYLRVWTDAQANIFRPEEKLAEAAAKFRDAFDYDPGQWDLDNEQPITITVTLGDWRRLNMLLPQPREDQK